MGFSLVRRITSISLLTTCVRLRLRELFSGNLVLHGAASLFESFWVSDLLEGVMGFEDKEVRVHWPYLLLRGTMSG